jgi:hypothetical protein
MWIGYFPVNREGWMALAIMLAVFIPCGYLFASTRGPSKWLSGTMAFLTGAIYNGVALWCREER